MKPQQQELGDTERRYEPQPVVRRGRGHMGGGGGGYCRSSNFSSLEPPGDGSALVCYGNFEPGEVGR